MEFIQANNPKHCFIVQQTHGSLVCVPPGYIHAVYNNRPCFKVAIDRIQQSQAHNVAFIRETIAVPFFGSRMPNDYVDMATKANAELNRNIELARLRRDYTDNNRGGERNTNRGSEGTGGNGGSGGSDGGSGGGRDSGGGGDGGDGKGCTANGEGESSISNESKGGSRAINISSGCANSNGSESIGGGEDINASWKKIFNGAPDSQIVIK